MDRCAAIEMLKSKMDGSVDTSYEWTECVRLAIEALENVETFEKVIRARSRCICRDCQCFTPVDESGLLGYCQVGDVRTDIRILDDIVGCCLYEKK